MPKCSFDIVSRVDLQEVDNAVNMTVKELRHRYDFREGKWGLEFQRKDARLALSADSVFKLDALREVLKNKLSLRKVSLKALDLGEVESAAGQSVRQSANLRVGIEKEKARQWYDKAVESMDKNRPDDEELIRFRSEAEKLLGVDVPAVAPKPAVQKADIRKENKQESSSSEALKTDP